MAELRCNSCQKKLVNMQGSTGFKCPSCAEETILRCTDCRKIAAKYECSKCKFTGPN
jgi:LSD1 subclass zinc finger protein